MAGCLAVAFLALYQYPKKINKALEKKLNGDFKHWFGPGVNNFEKKYVKSNLNFES